MAVTATSSVLYDGPQMAVLHFTGISDGAGEESKVLKVDVSTLTGPCSEVAIMKATFACSGMAVDVYCDATTDTLLWTFVDGQSDTIDFECHGSPGLKNNAGTGKTGDLLFSTRGGTSGDTYAITLWLRKII